MTDAESEATAPDPSEPTGESAESAAEDEGDRPAGASGDGAERGDPESDTDEDVTDATGGSRRRDVEVPFEVYKAVTVFSTLFAVGAVVFGFVLLDWGTERATADLSDVNVAITLAGLACIALGAGTYAFSTRFRARGMGNAKDGAD